MYRDYSYENHAGIHFPDTPEGSEMEYSIDASCYAFTENEVITSILWDIPEGLRKLDEYLQGETDIRIKIRAELAGNYLLKCFIYSSDDTSDQVRLVNVILKVY